MYCNIVLKNASIKKVAWKWFSTHFTKYLGTSDLKHISNPIYLSDPMSGFKGRLNARAKR